MNDIDLIPSDYRLRRWLERNARRFGIAVAAIFIVTAAAYAAMHHATRKAKAEIEGLRTQAEISARHKSELDQLRDQKSRYEGQLELLKGLRGGASAEAMFVAIDRAMTENDVWFVDWEFRRTGKVVGPEEQTEDNGYFIVLSSGENGANGEAWQIEVHMSIKGQANDHSSLSRFVRRLLAQPEIQDVHVLSSSQRNSKDNRVVEFDLSVNVSPGVVNS
ncbi:MAG: PilN domain-containing protein [Gammaproteobacteria bacterium]|jgi:hypothetical protein